MSSTRPNNLFIYGQMQPSLADRIIKDHLDKLSPEEQKRLATAKISVWLLRESRETGMLTLHRASYSTDSQKWVSAEPERLALQQSGWTRANLNPEKLNELRATLQEVDRDQADTHAAQLEKYIQEKFGLAVDGRINPALSQQTTAHIYSGYSVVKTEEKSATDLILPPDISEALRSPLSQKIFVDPVVCRFTNGPFKTGVTYDRDELIQQGFEADSDFYENLLLKKIINYIGSQQDKLSKLEKINDYEMIDTVSCEKIKDAFITPAGNSFSASTIIGLIKTKGADAKDPLNPNVSINADNVLSNYNLDKFISAWPSFYKKRIAEEKATSNEAKSEAPEQAISSVRRF